MSKPPCKNVSCTTHHTGDKSQIPYILTEASSITLRYRLGGADARQQLLNDRKVSGNPGQLQHRGIKLDPA